MAFVILFVGMAFMGFYVMQWTVSKFWRLIMGTDTVTVGIAKLTWAVVKVIGYLAINVVMLIGAIIGRCISDVGSTDGRRNDREDWYDSSSRVDADSPAIVGGYSMSRPSADEMRRLADPSEFRSTTSGRQTNRRTDGQRSNVSSRNQQRLPTNEPRMVWDDGDWWIEGSPMIGRSSMDYATLDRPSFRNPYSQASAPPSPDVDEWLPSSWTTRGDSGDDDESSSTSSMVGRRGGIRVSRSTVENRGSGSGNDQPTTSSSRPTVPSQHSASARPSIRNNPYSQATAPSMDAGTDVAGTSSRSTTSNDRSNIESTGVRGTNSEEPWSFRSMVNYGRSKLSNKKDIQPAQSTTKKLGDRSVETDADQRLQCVVCFDREKSVMGDQCCHVSMCQVCADSILGGPIGQRQCPMCRAKITKLIPVYL